MFFKYFINKNVNLFRTYLENCMLYMHTLLRDMLLKFERCLTRHFLFIYLFFSFYSFFFFNFTQTIELNKTINSHIIVNFNMMTISINPKERRAPKTINFVRIYSETIEFIWK